MTEEEAKTKWCPFARTIVTIEGDGNVRGPVFMASGNQFPDNRFSLCIVSACMAWRPTDNESAPSKPGDQEQPSKRAGYCGLAGKP